jgi:ubiquinone/menaquinone biosynthesis C-methylase UbiE
MTDTQNKVREHYNGSGLNDRIQSALDSLDGDRPLTVAALAPLDQFHLRGIHATAELARAAALEASDRVLDIGCGIGGPARYLADTFGCQVAGVDLSPGFIDAARHLTARCGLSGRVSFHLGDALHLPFAAAVFDVVFLQHVAMNIEDRAALYAEVRRVLAPGARFATYDLVLRAGDVVYPTPWARDGSTSFLLTEDQTRTALEHAGFRVIRWSDETPAVLEWFSAGAAAPQPGGPSLGALMGPEFSVMTANLARNLREQRLGVFSAVLRRG